MKYALLATYAIIGLLSLTALTFPENTLLVDPAASHLKWTGYHLGKSYEHTGSVRIKSGQVVVNDGIITSGEVIITMNSITNTDVKDPKDNAKLVNHLKSADFFDVKNFPEAKLIITGSELIRQDVLKTSGQLTIRGITKPIAFESQVNQNDGSLEATAVLTIQRTDFNVMYGWKIENAMLSGEFRMEVKLVAKK
jgi:polyisoprenoid-binding protein YceI